MRLFIATEAKILEFDSIKRDFKDIIRAKWVEERNLHLTWSFLGEIKDVDSILEDFKKIPMPPPAKEIISLGFFGREPKVLYGNISSKEIDSYFTKYISNTFKNERFKAHVTLCRIRKIDNIDYFKDKVRSYKNRKIGFLIKEIALYSSRLTPYGPIYKKIYKIE